MTESKVDEVVRRDTAVEKSKKNIHPWQRRTMGESFSGDTLLEYGGVECGDKGGRVAWKDPEDIKLFCGQIQQLTIIVQQYIYMYKYYVILFLSMDKNHNMKDEMAKAWDLAQGSCPPKQGACGGGCREAEASEGR